MAFIDREPGEGIATQQINKNYQSSQIIQANATGFGAASDDFMERGIDLNEQLIRNKPATFFFRVNSDAMLGAGIHIGDILIGGDIILPTARPLPFYNPLWQQPVYKDGVVKVTKVVRKNGTVLTGDEFYAPVRWLKKIN